GGVGVGGAIQAGKGHGFGDLGVGPRVPIGAVGVVGGALAKAIGEGVGGGDGGVETYFEVEDATTFSSLFKGRLPAGAHRPAHFAGGHGVVGRVDGGDPYSPVGRGAGCLPKNPGDRR